MGGEKHGAMGGQGLIGGELGFGVGHAGGCGDAHHLSGAAHLRAQQGVGAWKALEGQHGLLDRLQRWARFGGEPQLRQGAARHQLAGHLGQGHSSGLGHKGDRAGGTGVGLNDEHPFAGLGINLHRKLQIDQTPHPQG